MLRPTATEPTPRKSWETTLALLLITTSPLISIPAMRTATATEPTQERVGRLRWRSCRYDLAIDLNNNRIHYPGLFYGSRGSAKHEHGDLAGAIADFSHAIAVRHDSSDYIARGTARYDQGDYAGAIADFSHAIYYSPIDDRAYCHRGNARIASGDYAGAITDFDRALLLEPDRADAYYSRAFAKDNQGDYAGAISDLDRVIALVTDDEDEEFIAYQDILRLQMDQ